MIVCKTIRSFNKLLGFECSGHAQYNEPGLDIVCAGVSALTITCANALKELVKCDLDIIEKDGYLKVMLTLKNSEQQKLQGELLIKAMFIGIKDIAKTYPSHLKVKM